MWSENGVITGQPQPFHTQPDQNCWLEYMRSDGEK